MKTHEIPNLLRETEIVLYIGDDTSVHFFRDRKGHYRVGFQAPKTTTVVLELEPRRIPVAPRR